MAILVKRGNDFLIQTLSQQLQESCCEFNIKQGENMSNLRSVTLTLVDNNSNLKVKDRIVFQLVNHVTEHDDQRTIQNVLITGDVAKALSEHNKKRTETVDKQILRNTGRDVMLDEVEIHDLEWQIVRTA